MLIRHRKCGSRPWAVPRARGGFSRLIRAERRSHLCHSHLSAHMTGHGDIRPRARCWPVRGDGSSEVQTAAGAKSPAEDTEDADCIHQEHIIHATDTTQHLTEEARLQLCMETFIKWEITSGAVTGLDTFSLHCCSWQLATNFIFRCPQH